MNDANTRLIAEMQVADLPRRKSVALALVLACFLSWIGALYGNWKWALVGWFITTVAMVATTGNPEASAFVLVVGWIAAMIVSGSGAKARNDYVDERRRRIMLALED